MKRILVAFDGDEPAHRALERGAALAQAFEAELGIVNVTPWRRGRYAIDLWGDAEVPPAALQSAGEWLTQRGLAATLLSPVGDPGRTIEMVADAGGFDTIVVGARKPGLVSRFLLRSVSGHVATKSKATVVVAR
jgi:nucleotide-binding universal stress UspA family protein